VRCKEREI